MTETLLGMLVGHRLAMMALLAATLGVLLRVLKPALRRELRPTWVLLLLTLVAQGGVAAAQWQGSASLAAIMGGAVIVMAVLALIQLTVLIIYHVLLPILGRTAPRIAQDLTVTGLSIAWGLVWLSLSPMRRFQKSIYGSFCSDTRLILFITEMLWFRPPMPGRPSAAARPCQMREAWCV